MSGGYARAMAIKRMDNVLNVVDNLEAAKAFSRDAAASRRSRWHRARQVPHARGDQVRPVDAPVNALGLRRIMFAVEDIDEVVARLKTHGAELIGEMQYGDTVRLAYIRGPEGIIVALAEELG